MKVVAIIQARMSSSRLPGKIMADIIGKPMIWQVIHRVQQARTVNTVAVATSTHPDDDALVSFCAGASIPCYRGSLDDVLDRYYKAALFFGADVIIRCTADCPLIDPTVIDKVVQVFLKGDFDYVSNILECTYPDGLDTEVLSFRVLEQVWREAGIGPDREHVTTYIRNHREKFRTCNVKNDSDYSGLRWTVDEQRDLDLVREIFMNIGSGPSGLNDILKVLHENPELNKINEGIIRNEGYLKSLAAFNQADSKGEK